ncbi:MAG TPA: two-component regulator propeller domain-containing protein [Bryobacteraceae bacterium]|nr:two-component regulator propeller domain-containing protein [Bryobacteraceae bacterium]
MGLDEFDRRTGKVVLHVPLHDPSASVSFYEDRFGVFWVLHVSGSGLAVLDRKSNTVMEYSFDHSKGEGTAVTGVTSMLEDRNGTLWLATHGAGLWKFDRDRNRFVSYRHDPADPETIPQNNVESLFADREGSIWAGLGDKGITRFAIHPPLFQRFPQRARDRSGSDSPFIGAIFEDHAGSLWTGTAEALNRVDRRSGNYTSYRRTSMPGARTDAITIREDRSGNLWVGTYGHGLLRFDRQTNRFKEYRHRRNDPNSLSDDFVSRLLLDRNGTLWAASAEALHRFDPVTEKFTRYRPIPPGRSLFYLELIEDGDGSLWLGTDALGLQRFDPVTGQFTANYQHDISQPGTLSDNRVNSIHIDRAGTMWVGTQNGLNMLDRKSGTFALFTRRNGLPGNAVGCVLDDGRGNLWMSTNNGVARFNPELNQMTSYSTVDGLPGPDLTGWGACWKSRTGQMFFGGFSGGVTFHPHSVLPIPETQGHQADVTSVVTPYTLPVVLTDLKLFGSPVNLEAGSPLKSAITYTDQVTFSHHQNVFSIEFSALSYFNPTTNRYRYRLEPLQAEWIEVGSDKRFATYTTLPAGVYTFRVEGARRGGAWSQPGSVLRIEILPPWWQAWWFKATYGATALLLVWAGYRYRLHQITDLYRIRLAERVDERTRVARDLHDTLLQSFQGLMLRLQVVYELLPNGNAKEELEQTLERADQAIAEARTAVGDLRSSGTTANDLPEAVRALGDELATQDSAAFRLVVHGTARELQPIIRDELYGIVREALRNAFRHAHADHIDVDIDFGERAFQLRIRDDGEGIQSEVVEKGRPAHYGLAGIRERAKQIGGNLDIWTRPGAGTKIEFSIAGSIAYRRSNGRSPFQLFHTKQSDV